jgi:hypothetical protein
MVTILTYEGFVEFATPAEFNDAEVDILKNAYKSPIGRALLYGLVNNPRGLERIARFALGEKEDGLDLQEIASSLLAIAARMSGYGVYTSLERLPLALELVDGEVVTTSPHHVVILG